MRYLFFCLVLLYSCNKDETSTNVNSGIFYETHGGSIFVENEKSQNYWDNEEALYIPTKQPEEGGNVINLWYRNISENFSNCLPFNLGYNNAEKMDDDCDVNIQIIEQKENKLVISLASLKSEMSNPITDEEFGLCVTFTGDITITYQINDQSLTMTLVQNTITKETKEYTLSEDWSVSDSCTSPFYSVP